MKLDVLIDRVDGLRVADNERVEDGIAAVMTVSFHGGGTANIGLSPEALRTLVQALIETPPPPSADRAMGRH